VYRHKLDLFTLLVTIIGAPRLGVFYLTTKLNQIKLSKGKAGGKFTKLKVDGDAVVMQVK